MTDRVPTKLYCVTNTANGKLYAGVTSRDLSVRWNEHMKAYRGQQRAFPLHYAMRKYGPALRRWARTGDSHAGT